MGKFFGQEKVRRCVRLTNSVVRLEAGSFLKIGGQGYTLLSNLEASTAVSGVGGLDLGTVQLAQYYYVYAVVQSGTISLVISLSSSKPEGFNSYRKVGAFNTERLSTNIEQVMSVGEQPYSELTVDQVTGSGIVQNRFGRFGNAVTYRGLEIIWQQDNNDGDKFQLGKAGMYFAQASLADSFTSGQEIGLSLNSDAYGAQNFGTLIVNDPQLIFCNTRSSEIANHVKTTSNKKYLEAGSYLRAHSQGAGVFATVAEPRVTITKEGFDEIDWSL